MALSASDRHARVKALFVAARALKGDERERYLKDNGGDGDEILQEVRSLLEHDGADSVVDHLVPEQPSSSGFKRSRRWLSSINARRAGTLVPLVLFILLGVWVHMRVVGQLRGIRGSELQSVLEANVRTLRLWIEEGKHHVEICASDRRVVEEIERLLEVARDAAKKDLEASDANRRLSELMAPYLTHPGQAGWGFADQRGVVIADSSQEYVGMKYGGVLYEYQADVLDGRTVFQRPFRLSQLTRTEGEAKELDPDDRPFVMFLAPVRADDGTVIAVAALARRATGPFSDILAAARIGDSGESYAFGADGFMLSESRFLSIANGANASSILTVQVREPSDIAQSVEPGPLTHLAARAIASRDDESEDDRRGTIVEPYRNYRGAEVIGAYHWLSEYGFGVATEMQVEEAFAAVDTMGAMFKFVLVALGVLLAASALSSSAFFTLKEKIRREKRVGAYRFIREIGDGGMGQVYLAEHAMLKRPAAVKVLKQGFDTDEAVSRFEREVLAASKLRNPHTIEIYDYGRSPDGTFYYAMEYLPGVNLAELVAIEGPLPARRTIHILRQVCASLCEAHAMGLIHRDIKPQNIMLCPMGGDYDFVKVLDFGLVKNILHADSRELTRPARVAGSMLYMSPERLRDPKNVDGRADLYALGAVGHYLLSAKPLFSAETDVDVMYQIINEEPTPLSECPRPLAEIIFACLAKSPDERIQSVVELLAALAPLSSQDPWPQSEARAWWEKAEVEAKPDIICTGARA